MDSETWTNDYKIRILHIDGYVKVTEMSGANPDDIASAMSNENNRKPWFTKILSIAKVRSNE